MPKAFTGHHHWYSSIVDSLKTSNSTSVASHDHDHDCSFLPSLVHVNDNALHGFSASLSLDELEELKKAPWFINSYVDRHATLDTTHTYKFLSLNPSAGLWPASMFGEDVIIGVINVGFGRRARASRTMAWSSPKSHPNGREHVKEEKESARDISGHGSHVAYTAARNYVHGASYFGYAKGTTRGVAPHARLAVYKVAWEEGSLSSDVVAGIDQAIADGVDVLSISMGYDGVPLYEDPVAIASFAAAEKGVVLTSAASNVARAFAGTVTLGENLTISGWTMFPANSIVENLLIYDKKISACNSTKMFSKYQTFGVVLCDNIGSVSAQIKTITESRVVGAILVSDEPQFTELGGSTCQCIAKKAARAPSVASYSSRKRSLSPPAVLKRGIMAPGTLVLAAWIPTDAVGNIGPSVFLSSDYNLISGTLMACPHIIL
ncbi:hypothetical protein TIFTF001_001125 [Ficus carica]|uniref:Peptidase S8/S53 domain-containing protein n=1 Tax=Ficus carica TaxID=3494 RepID=A0AA88CQT9_FICCA|nr:hypothetical protein TIFTF001_001125 [Ficus carica]